MSSRLYRIFGPLVGSHRETTLNLGIDFTCEASRRVRGHNTKTKVRLSAAARRTKRLVKQRGVLGRRTAKVFIAGPRAGLQYGSEVHGMTDSELLSVRRLAAYT